MFGETNHQGIRELGPEARDMRLTEYIRCLGSLMDEHGDLEVMAYTPITGGAVNAPAPKIGHMKVLSPRERVEKFAYCGDAKGKMVVRV